MERKTLLALIVWAIQTGREHISVKNALRLFTADAEGCLKTYTDSSDELLFTPSLVGVNPLDFFTDYVLSYAKMYVVSGIHDYGKKLNKQICQ